MPSARCREMRSRLDAYVEHELPADAAVEVRRHLDGCPVCRTEETRIVRALRPLRTWTPGQAPSDLAAGLYARIADIETPRRRDAWRLQLAGAAASVLLVAVCIATVVRNSGPSVGARREDPVGTAARSSSRAAPRGMVGIAAPGAPMAPSGEGRADSAPLVEITTAPATGPTPPRLVTQPRTATAVRQVPSPASFLDVADSRGVTARALMSGGAGSRPDTSNVASALPATVARRMTPRPPPQFEEALNERVRVGNQVTELYGEAKWDEAGRLRAIRVRAETAEADADGTE